MNLTTHVLTSCRCLRLAALLTVAVTSACFAQIELVNNQWPTDTQGYNFYPDTDVTYQSRAFNNAGVGIPGIPFQHTIKQYAGQGYHTHETINGTVLSRPAPAFLSGETGVTDSNGIARAVVEFNGYAGWYTTCVIFTDPNTYARTKLCVNNNTRYTTGGVNGSARVPLVRYSGGLQPYDGPNQVNQSQQLHFDARHLCCTNFNPAQPNADYATHWVTETAQLQLLGASSKYKTDTTTDGATDLLDITRISLPDGGVYDNDVAGIAPGTGGPSLNWDTRVFEEHARGIEADITVTNTATRQTREFEALYFANCRPGISDPYGARIAYNPPDPFWKTQGVIHVTCSSGLLGTGLRGRGR